MTWPWKPAPPRVRGLAVPDIRIAGRPFAEQVAFFQRKVNVPTGGWWDLQKADHAHGFMVAGAFKADLLDDLRAIVEGAVARGTPLAQFRKEFDAIVAKHGWAYKGGRNWRTRVIYDTNLRQAFNAGRWAQLTSDTMRKVRPYLQYRHNDKGVSRNPRPLHVSWNGLVLPSTDPWWTTHAPMNGWGCKCGIRALSDADLKALGKTGPDAAPNNGSYEWTAPDGSVHRIPSGIDPGFDYNVGAQARSLPAAQRFGERVMQMPGAWRTRALDDATRNARDWHAGSEATIAAMLERRLAPSGETLAVGMLQSAVVDALAARQAAPATALIALADHDVAALVRRNTRDKAAVEALVRSLPLALANPDAVLLNALDGVLVYAWRQDDGRFAKVFVELGQGTANMVRSGGVVARSVLQARRYTLLTGALQ